MWFDLAWISIKLVMQAQHQLEKLWNLTIHWVHWSKWLIVEWFLPHISACVAIILVLKVPLRLGKHWKWIISWPIWSKQLTDIWFDHSNQLAEQQYWWWRCSINRRNFETESCFNFIGVSVRVDWLIWSLLQDWVTIVLGLKVQYQ